MIVTYHPIQGTPVMKVYHDPKFKIGDIVNLRPYEDFENHISIPHYTWLDMMNKKLEVNHIEARFEESVYYTFIGRPYAWAEKFLTGRTQDFFSDEDFDIEEGL